MNKQNKFVLFLKSIEGLTDATIRKLLISADSNNISFSSQKDVLDWLQSNENCFQKGKNEFCKNLTISMLQEAKEKRMRTEEAMAKKNIEFISFWDDRYPSRFKLSSPQHDLFSVSPTTIIKDFPVILYYKGDISILNAEKTVAYVGTRTPSNKACTYGVEIAQRFVREGNVIVSGLAEGCDTIGHTICLREKGNTVAFLGCGVDMKNTELSNKILETGGAIVSEYEPLSPVMPYKLVERDRLIALASDKVFVLETKKTGGTMHTVEAAQKYNKELYVLSPSCVDEPEGNQMLVNKYKAKQLN